MLQPITFADGELRAASPFRAKRTSRLRHGYQELDLFRDDALANLLENYPDEDAVVQTMDDSGKARSWIQGSIRGASGAAVLDAVRRGRLWLNLKQVHRHDAAYASLLDRIYEDLAAVSDLPSPKWRTLGLILSSPQASVPYHADTVTNILWQLRGRKRVHVYPPREPFLRPEDLERICAGVVKEELPHEGSFEAHAEVVDLAPGEALLWPQHAPHRVSNLEGLNVSLSTEHLVPETRRRTRICRANFVLRQCGLKPRSTATRGIRAHLKSCLACGHSAWKRMRSGQSISYDQAPRFVVDAEMADGIRLRSPEPHTGQQRTTCTSKMPAISQTQAS